MKKICGILLIAFVLFTTSFVNNTNAARQFNVSEAYQIGSGTWYTSSNKTYNLVYTYRNGQESTLKTDRGYTNPEGTSEIYFDYKGVEGCIKATYYPDNDTYYAALYAKTDGQNWHLLDDTLYKKAYLK